MKTLEADHKIELLINNKEVPAQQYLEVRDPGKLTDIVGIVGIGSGADVDQAVNAAHKAFLSWRNMDVNTRKEMVLATINALEESISELVPLAVREHGGLRREAETDFLRGAANLRYYSGLIENFMIPEQVENDSSWMSIEKVPKGVVGIIVPWNMPVVLTMMKLAPALLTGNTIVVKPSPTAAIALSTLLKRMAAMLPDGVINVVNGGAEVGIALTRHPLVRKIAFTGGTETGKEVLRNAANSAFIKTTTLELGGNDPAIILDDVNPADIIPDLLKGIYTRAGQVCFAVKRIYVPQSMSDKFFNTFCEFVDEYKVGHGLDPLASFGPLNNKKQYQFVKNLIEMTKNSGSVVRELGSKLDPEGWDNGYYILPHVVKAESHSLEIVSCEQFGPIIPIIPYSTIDQAIEFANDTEYGLCSSVWSNDLQRALDIARKIEAGATFINTHSFASTTLGMPFGGVKNSGIGREMAGNLTLSEYIDYHSIRYLK